MRFDGSLGPPAVQVLVPAAWTAVFLGLPIGPAHLAVPLVGIAAALASSRPTRAVLVLGAAALLLLAADVRYGSLELLVPAAVILGWAGRVAPSVWPGLLGLALVSVPAAARDGLSLDKLAVCLLIFGATLFAGRLVRHRSRAAQRAVARAEELAATDPGSLVDPVARAERQRVADTAARALRGAVDDVVAGTQQLLTLRAPTRAEVAAVRARGASSVEELRRMLLVLRDEPVSTLQEPVPTPSPWRVDLALAASTAVVAGLTRWLVPNWLTSPWLLVGDLGLVLALVLRRRAPVAAGLVMTAGTLPMVLAPPPDPDALIILSVGFAAIAWTLVNHRSPWTMPVLLLTSAVGVALGSHYDRDGAGYITVLLLLSGAVGRAWGEPDRVLREARERSDELQSALNRATAEAVRDERLRIARDLHDATGHAVGVLLMQLGAAEALAETAPARARTALEHAREAGEQARTAANPLLASVGGPGGLDPGSLRRELVALVGQWRSTGMQVGLEVSGTLPSSPDLAATCYRIVQEGLTNSAKHAPGAPVRVRVAVERRHLLVEVSDEGPARPDRARGTGLGLAGLRERVEALHGQFSAGPRRGGGHRVRALVPVPSQMRSST